MLPRCRRALLNEVCNQTWVSAVNTIQRSFADGKFLPKVGQTFETETVFDAERVAQFVNITGDANTVHEPHGEFGGGHSAAPGTESGAIVPGIMCAALFPAVIGTAFPGALYLSQTLKFRNPAPVGSMVRAEVTVDRVSGSRVSFNTICRLVDPPHDRLLGAAGHGAEVAVVQSGVTVVDGSALALLQGWAPSPEEDDWEVNSIR